MSFLNYGTRTTPRWTIDQPIFTIVRARQGRQATYVPGRQFGASCASVLLGPDLKMPGQGRHNPPQVGGAPWDVVMAGGPAVTFVQDENPSYRPWVRGHLINGGWGGSGRDWRNLTPLTHSANMNHKTVETYINNFLELSRQYEASGRRDAWYGVYYCVQCAADPFALNPGATDLYTYAPSFIRIGWRAVRIDKPVGGSTALGVAQLAVNELTAGALNAAPVLPFAPPARAWGPSPTLPLGERPGDPVLGSFPGDCPPAAGNGFDGWVEVHQG
ncbi:hypothetical protein WS72_27055 [Burkholderia savannae]|uniref:Uncharacterized protein n=1 Tax=Burkholderia savannae TaxID=1637837 RepID=A0ABR5T5J9_9BURK|nr:hypothetical protein [Burkholderia savannae]KWZ38495.1 hypothetical protein WS72_27055 [Burkholderia savannae]